MIINTQPQRISQLKLLTFCGSLLLLCALIALWAGAVAVDPVEWWRGVLNSEQQTQSEMIINRLRLPRTLLAVGVGALLGVSGALTQGLFRNPLADPSLIGVTAGASAGGSFAIVLSAGIASSVLGLWLTSVGAFVGGALAVWLVYRLATNVEGTSVATMLLAGIAISALVSSLTSVLEFSANNELLRRLSFWKMGGLEGANWSRVVLVFAVLLLSLPLLPLFFNALNVLLLGESEARYLGVAVERMKTQLVLLVAVSVGVAVAVAGTIAFVGLIVPHIMRLFTGPDHRRLIPASALGGAILVVLADTLARVAVAPAELPIGIVTAFVGAPFFIVLLRRRGALHV